MLSQLSTAQHGLRQSPGEPNHTAWLADLPLETLPGSASMGLSSRTPQQIALGGWQSHAMVSGLI